MDEMMVTHRLDVTLSLDIKISVGSPLTPNTFRYVILLENKPIVLENRIKKHFRITHKYPRKLYVLRSCI